MPVPAIIAKVASGAKKAKSAASKANAARKKVQTAQSISNQLSGNENGGPNILLIIALAPFAFIFLMLLLLVFVLQSGSHSVELTRAFGSNNSSSGGIGVNLNYDFEDYIQATLNSAESGNIPAEDLKNTEFENVDNFNQHIKESVQKAGYGTRAGVVAAGMALVGDYIKATGKRLRYDQYTSLGGRQGQDTEGIVNQNFFLDCSSFAWWAVYNGGFKTPSYPQTVSQMNWARPLGYLKDNHEGGQAGDFLVNSGHIMLIVGTYDSGYYVAEFNGWGNGSGIYEHDYSYAASYKLIDMTGYYNDASNVR